MIVAAGNVRLKRTHRLRYAALALLCSSVAQSGSVAAEAIYQVDVIVFENAGAAHQDVQSPVIGQGLAVAEPLVVRMGHDDWLLKAEARRINASGRFRTLLQTAWRQRASVAEPVPIGAQGDPVNNAISGTVQLTIGQSMALSVRATCHPGSTATAELYARRAIRAGQLHYIDHPACGMLVQVALVSRSPE